MRISWLILSFALLLPAVAPAQTDISGTWTLEAEVSLGVGPTGAAEGPAGEVVVDCFYSGVANVEQSGSSISGTADLMLDSGLENCPPDLSGTLTGEVSGSSITMGMLMGGALGEATFTGNFGPIERNADKGLNLPPNTALGSFAVGAGPFTGSGGSWNAALAAPGGSILDVPTAGGVALTVLTVLLSLVGLFWLRR